MAALTPAVHVLGGPMRVTRVFSDSGRSYTHEPSWDPEWSGLTKLRWWCAVHAIDYPEYRLTAEVGGASWSTRPDSYEQHYLLKLNGKMVEQGGAEFLIGLMWAVVKTARLCEMPLEPSPIFDALVTRYAFARALNTVPFSTEQRIKMGLPPRLGPNSG